jgi:sulfite exporter TauE/SafE
MTLIAAFLLGLFGSLHCVGMCGPIVMSIPLKATDKMRMLMDSMIYHFGRILCYMFLGLLMGVLGWGIYLTGYQKSITVVLGIVLVSNFIYEKAFKKKLLKTQWSNRFLPKLKLYINRALKSNSKFGIFKLGVLNGFLPCGLVYAALVGAVTANGIITSGLFMLFFGLGTYPLMLLVMVFGQYLKFRMTFLNRLSPYLMLLFGIFLIYKGISVNISPYLYLDHWLDVQPACH